MKLSDVYASGATTAQGTIKCTYAEIFGQSNGEKLFSMNKGNLGYNIVAVTNKLPQEGGADDGYVEIAVPKKAADIILAIIKREPYRSEKWQQLVSGDPIYVRADAIEWEAANESDLEEDMASDDEQDKTKKTILYVGLGLLALSFFK